MANIDKTLRKVLGVTLFVCLVVVWLVVVFHTNAQMRQGERELIYLQARQLATQERKQRLDDYKKRLAQQRRTQEYNQQSRVVDYNQ